MKTRTWILLLGALLLVFGGLSVFTLMPREASDYAQITSDGKVERVVDLHLDQQFTVTSSSGGVNTITVKDGKIAVTDATCPDHYCVQRGFCHSGTEIVCLPNRLVIRFLGTQEIDAVVG